MLDIGWTELLVVGVIALIVIGPKDLPGALHTFGKYVGRMRAMVRQFQDGIDDIARQEELRDLQRTVQDVSRPGNAVKKYLESTVDDNDNSRKDSDADQPNITDTGTSETAAAPIDPDTIDEAAPVAAPNADVASDNAPVHASGSDSDIVDVPNKPPATTT